MNILFLIDSLSRGGKERRMIELIKDLKENPDIKISLVVLSDRFEYSEINDLDIPVSVIRRKFKYDLSVISDLYKYCLNARPDIIHSWGTLSCLFAIPASKILKAKLINGNITNAPSRLNLLNRRYLLTRLSYPFVDRVVGNSKAGLRIYNVPSEKAELIYNGFNFNRLRDVTISGLDLKSIDVGTAPVIGMVGAFQPRKDFELFIKAAIAFLDNGNNALFLAIGDGPLLKQCKQLVPLKYKQKIIFPGLISNIEQAISILDIGILCTNTKVHGEGVSNVIMEYMALAKPVIATESGGTSEIIEDGITGFLIPPGSISAVIEKIRLLLNDPSTAKQMGSNGRERIKETFSIDRMTKSYLKVYSSLLENRINAKQIGEEINPTSDQKLVASRHKNL